MQFKFAINKSGDPRVVDFTTAERGWWADPPRGEAGHAEERVYEDRIYDGRVKRGDVAKGYARPFREFREGFCAFPVKA